MHGQLVGTCAAVLGCAHQLQAHMRCCIPSSRPHQFLPGSVETADLGDEEHQPANINAVVSSSSPRAAMVRQGSGHEKLRHVSIAAAGENQERPSQSSQSAAAQFLSVCKLPGVPSILGIKVCLSPRKYVWWLQIPMQIGCAAPGSSSLLCLLPE